MRDLAIKTNKVDNLLCLRRRLRDVVPTAEVFLDEVYQDTHQVSGILNLNPGYFLHNSPFYIDGFLFSGSSSWWRA